MEALRESSCSMRSTLVGNGSSSSISCVLQRTAGPMTQKTRYVVYMSARLKPPSS